MLDDKITNERLDTLYPFVKERAEYLYQEVMTVHGMQLRCAYGIRTFKRQDELYQQGRSTPGPIVTWARPGYSLHQYGLALDSFFKGPDPYLEKDTHGLECWDIYGRIAKEHGFEWGGDFEHTDRPHIQMTFGLKLSDIQLLYKNGGLPSVWKALDTLRGVEQGTGWADKVSDKPPLYV